MADLADRMSRGAVAALDLAPLDDRFSKLSRLVLTGGASRFAVVVDPDEPLHYVIPVGLPHERVEYGALLVQDTRVGIVWRDAAGHDRSRVVRLDPAVRPQHAPLILGGEQWTRFDLIPGESEASFLLPPVSTPDLCTTVSSLLRAVPARGRSTAPTPRAQAAPTPRTPIDAPPPVSSPAAPADPSPSPLADPDATLVNAPAPAREAATPALPLFRDERSTPAEPAPSSQAVAPSPAPAISEPPAPARATPPESSTGPSPTARGFVIGLVGSLTVGAIIVALGVFL